jgi:hypothetical protein
MWGMNNAHALFSLLAALGSLSLGASLTVAGLPVTRSSLLGYDVGAGVGAQRGLDAGEAATVAAQWLVAVSTVGAIGCAPTLAGAVRRPVVELLDPGDRVGLRSVCQRDGWTVEAWTEGSTSRRRVRSLRAMLGSRRVRERTERDGRHMVYWAA